MRTLWRLIHEDTWNITRDLAPWLRQNQPLTPRADPSDPDCQSSFPCGRILTSLWLSSLSRVPSPGKNRWIQCLCFLEHCPFHHPSRHHLQLPHHRALFMGLGSYTEWPLRPGLYLNCSYFCVFPVSGMGLAITNAPQVYKGNWMFGWLHCF